MNLDHYISVLENDGLLSVQLYLYPKTGYLLCFTGGLLNIKEDANDSIQFNLFQKNADMFFQCALISKGRRR